MDEKRTSGNGVESALHDVVRDAEVFYSRLKRRQFRETVLDFVFGSIIVWSAAFFLARVGLPAIYPTVSLGSEILVAFLVTVVVGFSDYLVRRRRGNRFTKLGESLNSFKQDKILSEDGLRLIDALHEAALIVESRKLELALEYGIVGFIAVGLAFTSAAYGVISGVIAFVIFAAKASEERRKNVQRYEDSKKELLQSL